MSNLMLHKRVKMLKNTDFRSCRPRIIPGKIHLQREAFYHPGIRDPFSFSLYGSDNQGPAFFGGSILQCAPGLAFEIVKHRLFGKTKPGREE